MLELSIAQAQTHTRKARSLSENMIKLKSILIIIKQMNRIFVKKHHYEHRPIFIQIYLVYEMKIYYYFLMFDESKSET